MYLDDIERTSKCVSFMCIIHVYHKKNIEYIFMLI